MTSPIRVAVDTVIFTIKDGELQTLLIQMKKQPFTHRWAFPGGLIEATETSSEAAIRFLNEQTGLPGKYLEQLKTFDDPARDPLGRVISIAYFALVSFDGSKLHTNDKYADVRWWPVKHLPELAYDHSEIAKTALERLRSKLEYTNIIWSLLPDEFTLAELQEVYECILTTTFDKRNFRKKILSLKIIKPLAHKQRQGSHRPAQLYRFIARSLKQVDIL